MPKDGYKQLKLDPKKMAKWWQDAEEQVRLAHPHESRKNQEKLTEKYLQSQISRIMLKKKSRPDPGEKQIAEWYRNELVHLRLEIPETPLKQRERMAAETVANKIKHYRRTIQLDTFFEKIE
ncbi:MAG: hypothetical protein ACW97Z_06725 [Candidatus Hodarchaeales archaeon]|jgi:hypothetical protein